MSEITIDKNAKQITFTNNGISFSQFGVANEILDLIENQDREIERLNNIIKKVEECIDYYAIENEDFSKFYNNEEIEILKIIGSEKE